MSISVTEPDVDNSTSSLDGPSIKSNLHQPHWLILTALCGGVIFTALFFGVETVGVNVPFFVALLVAVVVFLGRKQGFELTRSARYFAGAAILVACLMAFRRNDLLLTLDAFCVVILLLFASSSYRRDTAVTSGGLANLFMMPLRVIGFTLWLAKGLWAETKLSQTSFTQYKARWLPIIRGLLIALPILIIFGTFLASADENFAKLIGGLFVFDASTIEQTIWVLVVSWLGAGAMYFTYAPDAAEQRWQAFLFDSKTALPHGVEGLNGEQQVEVPLRFGAVEVCTVLACVLVMFTLFVYVQFPILFGGDANIAEAGVTYSSHARAGFFHLLIVATLCFAMLLACRRYIAFSDSQAQVRRLFVILNVGLILGALLILYSAQARMGIYENAYGYTYKRLVTSVFMVWLGLLFVWFLLSFVQRLSSKLNFNVGVCVMAIGFLFNLNLINPDATIAKANLERYVATGKIDRAHMLGLSADADLVLMDAPKYLQTMSDREWQEGADKLALQLKYRAIGRNAEQQEGWWNMRFNFSTYIAHLRAMELKPDIAK